MTKFGYIFTSVFCGFLIVVGAIGLLTERAHRDYSERLCALVGLAGVDGAENGDRIRRRALGLESVACGQITNVLIMPDHVTVFGTKGSRSWYP